MTAVEIVTITGNIAFWAAFLIVVWAMFRPDHRHDTRHVAELRHLVAELTALRDHLDTATRSETQQQPDQSAFVSRTPHPTGTATAAGFDLNPSQPTSRPLADQQAHDGNRLPPR